jgi:hypothetical protein
VPTVTDTTGALTDLTATIRRLNTQITTTDVTTAPSAVQSVDSLAALSAALAQPASPAPVTPAAVQRMTEAGAQAGSGNVYIYGPLTVQTQARSAEQMFADVLRVGQRRAVTRFGDSTLWSRVQD